MKERRKHNTILSRGVVAKVARMTGCSYQLTWHRIFVQQEPITLEIAAKLENEIRTTKKRAIQELILAQSININDEMNELNRIKHNS